MTCVILVIHQYSHYSWVIDPTSSEWCNPVDNLTQRTLAYLFRIPVSRKSIKGKRVQDSQLRRGVCYIVKVEWRASSRQVAILTAVNLCCSHGYWHNKLCAEQFVRFRSITVSCSWPGNASLASSTLKRRDTQRPHAVIYQAARSASATTYAHSTLTALSSSDRRWTRRSHQ